MKYVEQMGVCLLSPNFGFMISLTLITSSLSLHLLKCEGIFWNPFSHKNWFSWILTIALFWIFSCSFLSFLIYFNYRITVCSCVLSILSLPLMTYLQYLTGAFCYNTDFRKEFIILNMNILLTHLVIFFWVSWLNFHIFLCWSASCFKTAWSLPLPCFLPQLTWYFTLRKYLIAPMIWFLSFQMIYWPPILAPAKWFRINPKT